MTTIAWDGRVLAADSQCEIGSLKFRTRKIGRLKDGRLYGFAGDADYGLAVVAYLNGETEKPEHEDKDDWSSFMLIDLEQHIFRLERRFMPIEILEDFHAIGSGRDFAIAAMYLGKSAVEAVKIAALFDSSTGNEVDFIELGKFTC